MSGNILPVNLRCEYRVAPLGVDVVAPRLSWQLVSLDAETRCQEQTAYQVLVSSDETQLGADIGDLWDSGRVESDETIHIDYSGMQLGSRDTCYWKVRVWDDDGEVSSWSQSAFWTMGLLGRDDWGDACWIENAEPSADDDSSVLPAEMFRKEFAVEGLIKRATVHVTGLGMYELRINGKRIGDQLLAPEWTDYRKRIQYQTYDVTEDVRTGENAVGAFVGNGWYSSLLMGHGPNCYGTTPRFLMLLEVELEDGTVEPVGTDTSWACTDLGPIRQNSIYDGEEYDAGREMPGWDQHGFNDGGWKSVRLADSGAAELVWQRNEPIKVVRELEPVELTEPKLGVYVFDIGQNIAGWCRFCVAGSNGGVITARFAEMLNDDGTVYTENLRTAKQTFRYTPARDGEVTFEPHFTYFGFRYVELTGLAEPPGRDCVTARVFHSSCSDAGEFACSDAMLNKLMDNIVWTQRANLQSTPTDCPQRDERCGWTGDIQSFAQTAVFNMDMAAFFSKWMRDVRDCQTEDGRFPDIAPHPGDPGKNFSGDPGWGDAGVVVPWRSYQNYGDRRLLEESFESAKRWVDCVHEHNPGLIWSEYRGHEFNDWLNGDTLIMAGWPTEGATVSPDVFATAFFAHSTDLVSRMARVIGNEQDARCYGDLFRRIKTAFNETFVAADGRIESDTQAAYALALNFDLLPPQRRERAAAHMIEAFERYNGHLSTGIHSTHRLMMELSRYGYSEEAYRLVLLRDFPSWGMMIENGATTIWERWDGYVKGRGFQNAGMNSFNHYVLGAVGEWMWRSMVGINPDDEHPAYKHFVIRPCPGGGLTWAKGSYRSIRGLIESSWRIVDGIITIELTVPPNCSATVYVPADAPECVIEGGMLAGDSPGVTLVGGDDHGVIFLVGSGSYVFAAPQPTCPDHTVQYMEDSCGATT